jgi:serine/threonine protein kinase
MATDQTITLLDRLRRCELLDAARLDELSALPEAQDPDPRALGRVLFQRGWLTRFQISQVAKGRGKELCVGPYLLLDRLGAGGMGQVFRAKHQHMQRIVALKLILKERLNNAEAVKRFYQEVQAAAQLQHPNIVVAYDAGPAGNTHYFAMEYVEGSDLSRLVRESGPLPVGQACDYVRQVARGLEHARERGLVHRDIKPANLLVGDDGSGTQIVKILDMGLARIQMPGGDDKGLTRTGQVMGTPDYLAPEQARDARSADTRSDIYSLGCTLYFLLAGRAPFTGETLAQVLLKHQMEEPGPPDGGWGNIPVSVRTVLRTAMAKRPEERYQTPSQMADALEPLSSTSGAILVSAVKETRERDASEASWPTLNVTEATEIQRPKSASPTTRRRTDRSATATETPGARRPLVLLLAVGGATLLMGLIVTILVVVALRSESKDSVVQAPPVVTVPDEAIAAKTQVPNAPADPEPKARPPKETPTAKIAAPDPPEPSETAPVVPVTPPTASASPVTPPQSTRETAPRVAVPALKLPRFIDDAKLPVDPPRDDVPITNAARIVYHDLNQISTRVAISPSGRYGWFKAQGASLIELSQFRKIVLERDNSLLISLLVFLPDGSHVIGACRDKRVCQWHLPSGKLTRVYEGLVDVPMSLTVSKDGRYVAVGSGPPFRGAGNPPIDAVVKVWDVASGKLLQTLDWEGWPPNRIALNRDGSRLYGMSNAEQRMLRAYDVTKGKPLDSLPAPQITLPFGGSLRASLDGKRLLITGSFGSAYLYDPEAGEAIRRFPHPGTLEAVEWCGTRFILTGSGREVPAAHKFEDCDIRIWETDTGKEVRRLVGHTRPISSIAASLDGHRVLSGGSDGTVRLWTLSP